MTVRTALRRRLRQLLVWLLVGALPWSALSSIAKAGDCTGHGSMSVASVEHDPRPPAHAMDRDAAASDDDCADTHGPTDAGKCGHCAACVAGAAAIVHDLRIDPDDRTDVRIAVGSRLVAPGFREGLERPPRFFLD